MNQLFCLQHRGDRYLSHSSRHTQVPVPATISCANCVGTRRQHHHCAAETEGCGHHPLSHSFHNHVYFFNISNLHSVRKDNKKQVLLVE